VGDKLSPMQFPERDRIRYTPLFCEENIWWLARSMLEEGVDPADLSVLYLSNARQSILLANQSAAAEGRLVIWDYHVVLRARLEDVEYIFDPDTRLDFPEPLASYLSQTFPTQAELPEGMRTWVRSIPAASYLSHFRSDRRHMLGKVPLSAYPDYPIIMPPVGARCIDLSEYCDLQKALADGSVVQPVDALARG
jgi:protein N-terminal glutamine amidohydrolase